MKMLMLKLLLMLRLTKKSMAINCALKPFLALLLEEMKLMLRCQLLLYFAQDWPKCPGQIFQEQFRALK